jgi:hypothetical protein
LRRFLRSTNVNPTLSVDGEVSMSSLKLGFPWLIFQYLAEVSTVVFAKELG